MIRNTVNIRPSVDTAANGHVISILGVDDEREETQCINYLYIMYFGRTRVLWKGEERKGGRKRERNNFDYWLRQENKSSLSTLSESPPSEKHLGLATSVACQITSNCYITRNRKFFRSVLQINTLSDQIILITNPYITLICLFLSTKWLTYHITFTVYLLRHMPITLLCSLLPITLLCLSVQLTSLKNRYIIYEVVLKFVM